MCLKDYKLRNYNMVSGEGLGKNFLCYRVEYESREGRLECSLVSL